MQAAIDSQSHGQAKAPQQTVDVHCQEVTERAYPFEATSTIAPPLMAKQAAQPIQGARSAPSAVSISGPRPLLNAAPSAASTAATQPQPVNPAAHASASAQPVSARANAAPLPQHAFPAQADKQRLSASAGAPIAAHGSYFGHGIGGGTGGVQSEPPMDWQLPPPECREPGAVSAAPVQVAHAVAPQMSSSAAANAAAVVQLQERLRFRDTQVQVITYSDSFFSVQGPCIVSDLQVYFGHCLLPSFQLSTYGRGVLFWSTVEIAANPRHVCAVFPDGSRPFTL
jgi:hypothetical protein